MRRLILCLVFAAADGRAAEPPRLVAQVGSFTGVNALAVSPDGRFLATSGTYDTAVVLWDVASRLELRRFAGHGGTVQAVRFTPDGRRLFTASFDKTARLWDVATGRELGRFDGHTDYLSAGDLSADGATAVTGSLDGTVRVWATATQATRHVLRGHAGKVFAAAVSPDGTRVLSAGTGGEVRLWDAGTGRELRVLRLPVNGQVAVWHADGVRAVLGLADGRVALLDPAADKLVRVFTGNKGCVLAVAVSPDGKELLATGEGKTATVHELETGKVLRVEETPNACYAAGYLPGGRTAVLGAAHSGGLLVRVGPARLTLVGRFRPAAGYVAGAAVSPDGRRLFVPGSQPMGLWDLAQGRPARGLSPGGPADPGQAYAHCAAFSPDAKLLAVGFGNHTVGLFDPATGGLVRTLPGHPTKAEGVAGAALRLAFTPDGKRLLTTGQDKALRVWDVATGAERLILAGSTVGFTSLAVAADGKTAVTGGQDKTLRVWDLGAGTLIRSIPTPDWVPGLVLPPGRNTAIAGGPGGYLTEFDLATGRVTRQFDAVRTPDIVSLGLSPDGRRLAVGEASGGLILVEVASGAVVRRWPGHSGPAMSVGFTPDGRRLVSAGVDSTVRLWDAAGDRGELVRLVTFWDGSWAAADAAGRYDAANGGDVDGLHWVVGTEPIALNQLKERYYDPGLLAKYLGFNAEPLRQVAAFDAPKLYPAVAVAAAGPGQPAFTVTLTNRGGGIGRVVVRVNGKEVAADARPRGADPNAPTLTVPIDLAGDARLAPGRPNRVEVLAYNAEGYLASRGAVADFDVPAAATPVEPPRVWAVVAGASDYRGDAIDLRYAAKDAEDFAAGLTVAAGRLVGADRLKLTLLSTSAADPARRPTRDALVAALTAAAAAAPDDVVVVYLAGHGVSHGGDDGDFYYLTCDAATANLADPAVKAQTTLSSKELTDLLRKVPAQKQVLILDTCAAGRLVQKLTDKRDVPSSQVRAVELLKDRTGVHVLAGCAADAVSYEATRYAQGLLTHALLLGMKGAALKDGELVDVVGLFGFAADRVPDLARGVGGVQRPVVAAPRGGQSFPIGRVTAADQKDIPVRAAAPLVLRCNLQEEDEFADVLGLGKRVDDRMRGAARGPAGGLVFIDAAEFPDAYRLAGRYKVAGGTATVTVNVFRGPKRAGQVTASGPADKPDDVADRVAEAVAALIRSTETK